MASRLGLVPIIIVIAYEADTLQSAMGKGVDALKLLMEAHQLNQCDLPEIGSQGVISEILHGKRSLNLRQVRLLAKRFHVAPTTFINDKVSALRLTTPKRHDILDRMLHILSYF